MRRIEPAHRDLDNPDYREWLRFLETSESWSRTEIEQYQIQELRRIVEHANRNTAGYRRLFIDAGVTPDSLRDLGDIRKFPTVKKELLRDDLAGFTAFTEECAYVTTGGSTGIPFGFYREDRAFARELASKAHQYHRIGWKEGDRQIVLRGLPINSLPHAEMLPEYNELRFSSYHLVPEKMDSYIARTREYDPDWLRCYPSAGYIFARHVLSTGKKLRLKGILCASENLYDYQKATLREAFGGRVFSHYGHYELAVLAGFCEFADTYHVLPQYGYAELLNRDMQPVKKMGEMGEIVATSFLMKATPFIRYRTNDFAVLKSFSCDKCKRPYQIWDRIEGRLQEFIVTGGGRWISMTAMNMHDGIFDSLKQFQFYQKQKGSVEFRFVRKKPLTEPEKTEIRTRLMEKLGEDVDLRMKEVDEIPLTGRGKQRFLIQEMQLEFGDA